jgi:DNA modification methylase
MSEFELHLGDCLEILPTLAADSVDAVVTDPPYGIGYASSRTTRIGGEPRKNGNSFGKDVFCDEWLSLTYTIQKNNTPFYVFTRWDVIEKWKASIERTGYKVVQRLIWDKAHWKMGDLRYYGSQIEDILFCRKGTPKMQYDKRCGNIFKASSGYLPEGQYDHPTQKPASVIRDWVEDSTKQGDTILDPFMGSGTTGVACMQTGRNFIGIEIEPKYYDIAERRIKEAKMQLRLGI